MKKIFIPIIVLLAAVSSATAQEFSTTYFLDNNLYSYRINPAIPGEKNFVGFLVSNVNLSFGSNASINSFLYPSASGTLVTGFHSSVSSEQFINNLPKNLRADQVFNENIVAVGFWTKNAFHNIEINIKEDVFAGLPRGMFELAKCGSSDYPYDLSQTNVSAKSYAEIAYGYTRKIGEKFSVGGRIKLLMGLAAGNAGFDKANFYVNGDKIEYDASARFRLSSNFLKAGTKAEDPSIFDFSAFNLDASSISPCGWGAAVDLGMTYKPIKGLTVSFSVLDLGGINWKYNIVGNSSSSGVYTGETVKSDGTIKGDYQKFLETVEELANFKQVDGGESSFDMLACTMNLGARYYMPFYERLSVGLLATCKIDKYNSNVGARLGATVTPLDWLSITGNYGVNSYCKSYGLALSLNAANLNFVFGYEGYSGKVSNNKAKEILSPFVTPLGSFQNMVKAGVNITFGPRHNDFKPIGKSFIHGRKAE